MDDPKMPESEIEWQEFYKVINQTGAIAVFTVGASILDSLLRRLIIYFSTDDKIGKKTTDEPYGPISTFNERTMCAYAFGLISEDEYNNLNIIRKVRNEYAHKYATKKYDENKINKLLSELVMPGVFMQALSGYDKFRTLLGVLSNVLVLRTSLLERNKTFNQRISELRASINQNK